MAHKTKEDQELFNVGVDVLRQTENALHLALEDLHRSHETLAKLAEAAGFVVDEDKAVVPLCLKSCR